MSDASWVPNLLIPGAPKAGTSSLQRWLAEHTDAVGSVEKETYYFSDPGTHMYRPDAHIANGLNGWRKQFPIDDDRKPRVIIESTPGYLYYNDALTHIPGLPSNPKCVFLLREPGAQIHSLYTYFKDNWDWIPADMSFAEFLSAVRDASHDFKGNELAQNALKYARYIDFLKPWHDRLGSERMLVATFDDLLDDGPELTKRIASWVGLDPNFYNTYGFPRENETYTPKNRLLQTVNVKIRGLLPKGRLYDATRNLYRQMNTKKGRIIDQADTDLIRSLGLEFTEANRDLAQKFDLNLTNWPT